VTPLEIEVSQVKVTRPINAETEKMSRIFRRGEPTNFKLGIGMEYNDPHY